MAWQLIHAPVSRKIRDKLFNVLTERFKIVAGVLLSDVDRISPHRINTISNRQVMGMKKYIN